jgi:NitT/TauT family transport system ATP-binding protein
MSDRIIVMGRGPGRIVREIIVPEALCAATPLQARGLPEYSELFQELWEELEEKEEGVHGA